MAIRNLVVVLGDQLDRASSAFDGFDPARDAVWMAEVTRESTHVWSHKARVALFLSAMRHFREELRARGWRVLYTELAEGGLRDHFHESPQRLVAAEPGDYRVLQELKSFGPPLEIRPDRHFLCSLDEFRRHAQSRKQLRMEYFYREMRRRHGILMDGGAPAGGAWNYDRANRESFGKRGPGVVPPPVSFPPDAITREVLGLVQRRFPNHPGNLARFDWPVTPAQAKQALDDFLAHRLSLFGRYQDAMWTAQPWLYHSRLSAALNLKLLDPRSVIGRAAQADAPLEAREGFIRQILGWREYVRGVYWLHMPAYAESNALGAKRSLPAFYWTGETEMNCLREAISQTLEYGYAHHIQRLMITGLFALLYGVEPRQVHEWYLAVYVDAVEWVELPNTIGMSQFADGGLMASKPYAASGKYIDRMSDYCSGCRYDPAQSTGPRACPFTTLYWDFLLRNEPRLAGNRRMAMQLRNLLRLGPAQRAAIRRQAAAFAESLTAQRA
jgi:deoxyribodipyrimidine photolyase-related protein